MSAPKLDDAGRTYRGAGPQQRQDERRARLIDAAVEVFGTSGYRSATVEKVCATAGLTKRYMYESFDGSEALLVAAYTYATDTMRDSIVRGATAGGADFDERVRNAMTAFFTTIGEDPRLAKIAFVEILGVSPEVDRIYRKTTETFVATLMMVAESAFGASGLPAERKWTLATGMVGAVLLIAQQWVLAEHPQPIDSVVASSHSILVAVLRQLKDATPL